MVAARAERSLQTISETTRIPYTTLSRLERGTHSPSAATALALARWLGWSVEEVLVAAATSAASAEASVLRDDG